MPSKLSNSDSRTIRLAREALGFVVDGAMRRLETQYGPDDDSNRSAAIDALLLHLREELENWPTAHEIGDASTERTAEETALTDDSEQTA